MPKRDLCLGLNDQFGDYEEQLRWIGEAGFTHVFLPFRDEESVKRLARAARREGLGVQSVHAPFGGCRAMWEADEDEANAALSEIAACIRACAENGIPIVVSHAYIGFDLPPLPLERGLARYGALVREAESRGVKLAFENTEGEEYLAAILERYGSGPAVGFCLDTGHEMCYNRGENLLAKWGKLLIATHINDNLGIKDKGGRITWHDDLHLLPFDGIRDWAETARRFAEAGFSGPLTFELNTRSKPGRHENDIYAAMPVETYLAEAYKRACRFENLLTAAEKQLQKPLNCGKI